jgi:hypothetical protein
VNGRMDQDVRLWRVLPATPDCSLSNETGIIMLTAVTITAAVVCYGRSVVSMSLQKLA